MGVTTYYSAGGELLGHRTDVGAAYGTDALGSVTVTAIDDQQRTPTNYYYKPYGSRLNKLGNNADPRYLWNGTSGYRETAISHSKSYVRARHLGQEEGRWTTVDPLWPAQLNYCYAWSRPTRYADPSGLGVGSLGCGKNGAKLKEYCDRLNACLLDPVCLGSALQCIGPSIPPNAVIDILFAMAKLCGNPGGPGACFVCPSAMPANCKALCASEKGAPQTQAVTVGTLPPDRGGIKPGIACPTGGWVGVIPIIEFPGLPSSSAAGDLCRLDLIALFLKDYVLCGSITLLCKGVNPDDFFHELAHGVGVGGSPGHDQNRNDLVYRIGNCLSLLLA